MQVDFEEKDHVYFVNGEIASISVTELLHKHGLAPNYGTTPKERLEASAQKGKEVHKGSIFPAAFIHILRTTAKISISIRFIISQSFKFYIRSVVNSYLSVS